MRTLHANLSTLVLVLAFASACGDKPEQPKQAEVAQLDPVEPAADTQLEGERIEGQGEVEAPEVAPVEPEPVADDPVAVEHPPADDEDDEDDEDDDEDDEDDEDDDDDDAEPPPYPAQVGADPGPFVHPPAEAVIVVASTRSYSAGESAVDRDAKYHTWIWRPAHGDLPTKGKVAAAEGAPAIIEEHDGLIVSDGKALVQLIVEEVTVELPQCKCLDENDWKPTGKTLAKKLFELRSTPFGAAGDARSLIGATDFERSSKMDCIIARNDVEHVLQVAAVAGPRVFVVERVHDKPACDEFADPFEQRALKLIDVSGGAVELATLERELPYKVVRRARTSAAEELGNVSSASAYKLAPINLLLVGMFPKFREHRGGIRLLLKYAAAIGQDDEGSGGWGHGYDAHVITVAYPESSSLTAPAQAMKLIEYVHREGGSKWKVLGWSQIDVGAASSGAAKLE